MASHPKIPVRKKHEIQNATIALNDRIRRHLMIGLTREAISRREGIFLSYIQRVGVGAAL